MKRWILFCLAGLAFFAPLKFGVPVTLHFTLAPPGTIWEWIFFVWPMPLVSLFAFGALTWLFLDRDRQAARADLLFYLPVIFLVTQIIAMPGSIAPQTSADTLMLFGVGALMFYAAAWYVRDSATAARIFGALGVATMLVIVIALEQHFGGLQQTRDLAAQYAASGVEAPPDFLQRLSSDRVFGPMVYPNSLAGYLVLVFGPILAWLWARGRTWSAAVKWLALVLAGGLIVFCLALTGSRGGFVAFVASVMAGLFCFGAKGSRRLRWAALALVAIAGLFVLAQQAGFVSLRTESVSARRDYWEGAVAIARDHPWRGTGPGTFGSIYTKYKTAGTEEAQLAHNNFLQMWSDSGVFGFVAFALLWLVGLRDAFVLARQRTRDAAAIAICAALAGWTVHSLVDFDLYVPAIAMPAFLLLGILQGLKDAPQTEFAGHAGAKQWLVAGVCVLMVGGVFWVEGRALLANFAYGRQRHLEQTNPFAAVAEAERSIRWVPHNPHYRAAAGDLAAALGRYDDAIEHYEAATGLDPYRASYRWRLARVYAAAGRLEAAREQLLMAQLLNPTKQRYRQELEALEESVRHSTDVLLESAPPHEELDSPAATP